MKLPKDQPFWTSVILHLAVLLGLFLATIVQAFKPKEEPHVFEMVEPPGETIKQVTEPAPTPPPESAAETPEVELPPVPSVDIPKPQPQPQPQPKPKPKPQPVQKPQPPEPQIVNYRDFTQKHPKQDPPRRATPSPRKPIKVRPIDVPKPATPSRPAPSRSDAQLSQQQQSALRDYNARLRSRIDAAWTKPPQLVGDRQVARVVFDVAASGRITNVRLNPGSGNTAFDQSVLAAFRKANAAGPTPTGRAHQFSLSFSMRD